MADGRPDAPVPARPGVPAPDESDQPVGSRAGSARSAAEVERRVRRALAVGWPVLKLLSSSWRVEVEGYEPVAAVRRSEQPVILSCWHGQLLPLMWHHRREGVHALISEHRDGEIVARVAQRLGFETVRGSTSRGGGRALLTLVRLLKEGHDIAITPDGPRGPAHVYAPGALLAAQRAGAPVVPIAVAVDRAWRLRSWDRFIVPKPFARLAIAYGEPTWVAATSARGAAAEVERFAALHAAAVARAEAVLARAGSGRGERAGTAA